MRLIDADALIKKLNDEKAPYRADINKIIREMTVYAPVINEPQWIPATERLPENDGWYICTFDGELVGQDEPFVGMDEIENGVWHDGCVIAWMPMPEPYEMERKIACEIPQSNRWLDTV